MRKRVIIMLCAGLILTGCGSQPESTATSTEVLTEESEVTVHVLDENTETPLYEVEGTYLSEWKTGYFDEEEAQNKTFRAFFTKNDLASSDPDELFIEMEIYETDKFTYETLESLSPGDTITIGDEKVSVKRMDTKEKQELYLNGGLEEGGYTFTKGTDGFYTVKNFTIASYRNIGTYEFATAQNLILSDSRSGETHTYEGAEAKQVILTDEYGFHPESTTVTTVDGVVTEIIAAYTQ